MHKILPVLWACLLALPAWGQTTTRQQIWLGVWAQIKLSERWGVWLDGQYRTADNFLEQNSVIAGRIGAIYKPSNSLRLVAGYAYFGITPLNGISPTPHEHRGWQMLQWTLKNPRLRLVQALRTEQRFREKPLQGAHAGEYVLTHRFRYNVNLQYPLKKHWAAVVGNECMFNAGKEVVWNTFDQNRTWVGIQRTLSPKWTTQVLYMFLYQHLPQRDQFLQNHVIRLSFFKSE